MSDNRNYAVGVQNQGGAPVYMEDLKLSERSPVPNAASIANLKFLLTTGDDEGFRTAIKSYIDESIRSALGALVDNLDKGTGVSRILGTDSNHDLGTITLANLFSVLGGIGGFVNIPEIGTTKEAFIAMYNSIPDGTNIVGKFAPTGQIFIIGRKSSSSYGVFMGILYSPNHSLNEVMFPVLNIYKDVWTWNESIFT